jgi:DNA-binding IclR family transcriptional regulator
MTDQGAAGVKSAERALSILDLLTRTEQALTFGEIADALGYPRSSLHGLLRTLHDRGWITLDPATRRYSLGIRAWEAGNAYLRAVDLADRARPYISRVRDALDETVQVAVLDGRHNVYITKAEGGQRLVLDSEVGRRLEAHATGQGKVLLAGLDPQELDTRLTGVTLERFTDHTITDHAALRAELDRIQARGYAEDNEEYTIGVHCVAVPVRDRTGAVTAAMSISVPTVRFGLARRDEALRRLDSAARELSTALGYRPAEEGEPALA